MKKVYSFKITRS